jgi:hypothetical protein
MRPNRLPSAKSIKIYNAESYSHDAKTKRKKELENAKLQGRKQPKSSASAAQLTYMTETSPSVRPWPTDSYRSIQERTTSVREKSRKTKRTKSKVGVHNKEIYSIENSCYVLWASRPALRPNKTRHPCETPKCERGNSRRNENNNKKRPEKCCSETIRGHRNTMYRAAFC